MITQEANCPGNRGRLISAPGDINAAVQRFIEGCRDARGWIKSIGLKIGEQSLAEALDNANEHSSSGVGAFVGAWVYGQDGPLHIAVIDLGIGIPNHLRQREVYRDVSDEEALTLSVQERVSGLDDRTRGFGLAHLRRAAREVGRSGLVAIRAGAGEFRMRIRGRREQRSSLSVPELPGTWMRIEVKR